MALISDPYIANIPRQMSNDEIIQALRVDIVGEFEAIIGYEAHILATNDERVKKVLHHIVDEEKNHVGELQQLLGILAPTELQHVEEGKKAIQDQQQSNFQKPLQ